MDHYEVLGVSPEAGLEEIRRAYLAAARRHHPDRHAADGPDRGAAEQRMRQLNQAWEVLSRRVEPTPAATEWQPYDPSPGPGFDERHDRPISRGGISGWLTLAPVLCFAVAVACIVLGGVTGVSAVVAFGLFSLLVSGALFVIAPLMALTSSRRGSGQLR